MKNLRGGWFGQKLKILLKKYIRSQRRIGYEVDVAGLLMKVIEPRYICGRVDNLVYSEIRREKYDK